MPDADRYVCCGEIAPELADYLLKHGVIVQPVGWENMRKEDERK